MDYLLMLEQIRFLSKFLDALITCVIFSTFVHCLQVGAQLFAIYNRYDVNYTDEFGLSHFHVACAFGFENVVLKFLEFGRIVPDRIVTKARESPLYLALRYNRKNIVKVLLRADCDPNILLNDEKRTVLHEISQKHYDYGTRTAMIIELSKERDAPARVLLKRPLWRFYWTKAPIRIWPTVKDGLLCISFCHHGRRSVGLAKLLMNKSTVEHLPLRIDTEDHQGNTPLHLALESKRFSLAEFLLDKGANPNLTNVKNETALHLISRRRVNDRTLKILFDRPEELRIDIQDKEGNTPVHLALMRYGNKKAAEYLLSRRPNPTLDNAEGLTPLHICLKNGHEASAKFFSQMVDQLDLSGRAQFQRALACLLAPGELDVLLDRVSMKN
ncbi:unnamed protein product [Trichogramma brassicae]|uniref:Uncharacterized protein n=1 Tax=Trichogramma brassicae TaxID=86971 RepID=A0A6H5IUF7_9HYME|nr:unnamed protein product [Trichogramma brassicae]